MWLNELLSCLFVASSMWLLVRYVKKVALSSRIPVFTDDGVHQHIGAPMVTHRNSLCFCRIDVDGLVYAVDGEC